MKQPHIVVVGGGFGGLSCACALKKAPVQVTLVDRSNHHLFQPLLYQVATAGLSPADISAPIRSVLRKQKNTDIIMAEVTGVDVENKRVIVGKDGGKIPYDYLVIATGAHHSYFGHDEWATYAPGLKTIADATCIRTKILLAFEAAEFESHPERRQALLTFVIVGAGPTGVELAGALAELAQKALASDFRHIDPGSAKIILIEAGPRILVSFPEVLSRRATQALTDLKVEVRVNSRVEKVDKDGVFIGGQRLHAKTVIWAAGVVASPAGRWLNAEMDRVGRVKVNRDLTVPGHDKIFVIGDTASLTIDGKTLPGLSPVAMQEGRYVASVIKASIQNKTLPRPFKYHDKGNLATVGRSFAIADFQRLQFSGFVAWLLWLAVHIYFLISFRNRLLVMLQWAWAYITFQRGARLIVADETSDCDAPSLR